jgi:hypothetical protein
LDESVTFTEEQLAQQIDDFYPIQTLKDGRRYIDFYKVIHWNEIRQIPSQQNLARLRREFLKIPTLMEEVANRTGIKLHNSTASDGNFLEVINLVLNAYDKYYVNRDLTRTGQEIVMISPGVGLFHGNAPILGGITTKRLMDIGLSIDLICLAPPPLHSVPIFRYRKRDQLSKRELTYYRSPDWINISFYRNTHYLDMSMASPTPPPNPNQDVDTSRIYDESKPLKNSASSWEPTCRMPNMVKLDLQKWFGESEPETWKMKVAPVSSEITNHDDAVFKLERRRKRKPIKTSLSQDGLNHISTSPSNALAIEIKKSNSTEFEQGMTPPTAGISPKQSPRVNLIKPMKPGGLKPQYNPFQLDRVENDDVPDVALSLQKTNQTNTFHRRRWAHLHPTGGVRPTQKSEYIKHFLLNINWQSLTEPACLPLTTDYWPGASLQDSEEFILNNYNVTDQGNYEAKLDMFIRELVQQRLHEGFQLYIAPQIVPPNDETPAIDVTQKSPPTPSLKKSPAKVVEDFTHDEPTSFYLCSAHQFHHISINRYNRNLVVISTYQHISEEQRRAKDKKEVHVPPTFQYRYMLWNSTLDRFEPRGNIRFKAHVGEYLWNKLDYLICGEHRDMSYDLHNRSLQFHLIPISTNNRTYFNYPNTTMLLSSSSSLLNSGIISGGPLPSSPLTANTKVDQQELENRVTSFKKFFDGITGRNFKLSTEDSLDISYAEPSMYCNEEQYAETVLKQAIEKQETLQDRERPRKRVTKLERILTEESDRYEWVHLVHKTTYHPSEAYVFSIRWLVCSSVHIDDYLQTLTRRAKQCGFALVQTPIDAKYFTKATRTHRRSTFFQNQQQTLDEKKMQEMGALIKERVFKDGSKVNSDLHPFRSFVNIPLHGIEAVQEIKSKMPQAPFNFIPEYVPATLSKRFVHESGCMMLKFHSNHTLVWIDNPFQSNPHLLQAVNPRGLLASLQKLCEPYQTAHQIKQENFNTAVEDNSYDIVTEKMLEKEKGNNSNADDLNRFMDDMAL